MSGLFGGGDGGASKQLELQRQQIAQQEAGVARERTELAKRTQAGLLARRGGGLRFLMSGVDESDKTKLGG